MRNELLIPHSSSLIPLLLLTSHYSRQFLSRQARVRLQVFVPGSRHDFFGHIRRRAVLVPAGGFQPVADELLVIGRRALANTVLIQRPEARTVRGQNLVDEY